MICLLRVILVYSLVIRNFFDGLTVISIIEASILPNALQYYCSSLIMVLADEVFCSFACPDRRVWMGRLTF